MSRAFIWGINFLPNLFIFENTSKDSLTKKTKLGKDSCTIFWGFRVCASKSTLALWSLQIKEFITSGLFKLLFPGFPKSSVSSYILKIEGDQY